MSRWLIGSVVLVLFALAEDARADIFSFTDDSGSVHFSNVPTDKRFRLILSAPVDAVPLASGKSSVDWMTRSGQFEPAIALAAKVNTLSPALVRAVIAVESGFNPRAVSKKGAVGLMQLQPATARRYGVKDIFDPNQNIRAGARYLSDLLLRFDSNLELALAAYNAGEEAVERYGRHVPPYAETRSYVPSVMRVYQQLLDQARTG